jgi:DNA-binding NarL/FixJ family response regulator
VQDDLKDARRGSPTANDSAPSLSVVERLAVVERLDSKSTASLSSRRPIPREQPDDPISTTTAALRPEICLGVVDEYPFTRECISNCLKLLGNNLEVLTFSSIEDCMKGGLNDFDLILFHIHGRTGQQQPDQTIASLTPTFQSFPVIILSDLDANEWVLEAIENGARGYIPTGSTSVAVAVEVIRLVRAGGTFVPPSSLRMMQHSSSPPEEPFTTRQLSVLQHLTQGRSNKIIAYELGMSESTVKVHVRNIMKKMKATNRTEAAFRARNLLSPERQRLVVSPQAIGLNGAAS